VWARMQARDWAGVGALLDPDVRVEWPVTGEVFRGRDAVVGVNAEYPEGWEIRVLRVLDGGDGTAVSEVAVPQDGVEHRAVSFWTLRDGLVTGAVEYWSVAGGETPPAWRERFRSAEQ
jgi:ketosteroid isomerase-like protein